MAKEIKGLFPIRSGVPGAAGFVPASLAERAHRVFCYLYGDVPLARLAQQGGFGWGQFASLLDGHEYDKAVKKGYQGHESIPSSPSP